MLRGRSNAGFVGAHAVLALLAFERMAFAGGAPEIDPGSATTAVAVLVSAGLLLFERSRRNSR